MRQLLVCMVAAMLFIGSTASAQTRVFVSGSVFGDLKQTSSGDYFREHDDTAIGAGIRVGAFLSERWSVELGVDVGGRTSRSAGYYPFLETLPAEVISSLPVGIDVSIFPPIYDFKETERLTTVSILIGYRPAARGKVRPGFAGGLSLIRDVTESGNRGIIPLDLGIAAAEYVRNGPAATVAFEVAIEVTPRLSVVPEIRAHAYDTTTVYRPGVAVRWELR
jgi:hypothetical protein